MNIHKNICLLANMIEEPLRDIVAQEYSSIVFKCKASARCISSKWHKEGVQIEESGRIQISYDGKWHRLEITLVTMRDYGVYFILLSDGVHEVFSKANLYVREIKDKNSNDVLYMNPKPQYLHVTGHLKYEKVLVGDAIRLQATFSSDIIDEYLWYRDNRPLIVDERMLVKNDGRSTTLAIMFAIESDTGIYHVVCTSENGIASSFTSVVVTHNGLITLYGSEVSPSVDESLPEEVEVNVGEEVRLMCKVTYGVNTIIQWCKNGIKLEENNNISIEYYNNRYIYLRIKNASMVDTGEYSIQMRDEMTNLIDISTCFLTVNHSPTDALSIVWLKEPLKSIVTCIGSSLTLNCSFVLDGQKYFYVVWYIGHYKVERTNHRFHVANIGGDFFIFIKQVVPGMSGEITCELRKALTNKKSVVVRRVSANLTIVPTDAINNEVVKLNYTTSKCNIFNTGNSKLHIPVENMKLLPTGIQQPKITANGTNACKEEMVMTYCRLDNESIYFDIINTIECEVQVTHTSVYENYAYDYRPKTKSRIDIIEWCTRIPNNADTNETQKKWYKIEFRKTCDDFVEAGVSSIPMLELKDPPLEQVMKIRITLVEPPHNTSEARVCIASADQALRRSNKQCDLKPREEFNSLFTKTGDIIGSGAFGIVFLVENNNGDFYAAKILKTRTQKKKDTAMREYEVMKKLSHPKLVELYATFIANESFILVMDYLWGGELFDRIVEDEHIRELDVVPYVRQICEALDYLHSYKIVHLDIKPENIICTSPNSRQVKIIDFGLARVLDEGQTRAIYGTRDYVAPEVLNYEPLTLACDMWSLGVITYLLLSGVLPFNGDSWPERSANITRANYNYHESAFNNISKMAKDFVNHLLILQPEKRMKAFDALNHKWIVEGPPKGAMSGHMKRARQNLKSYLANNRARWQRAGNVMIAAHRLRNAGSQRNTDADRASPKVT